MTLLPDSEGVWWAETMRLPILFEMEDGVLLGWDGEYWNAVTAWPPTRWVKIEKPDFTRE